METYVAITGEINSLNNWETDVRGLKFPHKWAKGKENEGLIRLGVCPVRIYKLIHPKEHLGNLMNHIGVSDKPNYVTERYKSLKVISALVRKMLGLKKSPLPKAPVKHMQPDQTYKAVAIVPIGYKEDLHNEEGFELL